MEEAGGRRPELYREVKAMIGRKKEGEVIHGGQEEEVRSKDKSVKSDKSK